MTKFDSIYKDIVLDILNNGQMQKGAVRAKYEDGTPAYTKYVYGVSFEIKPEDGLPILQSKHVGWKTALKEIDWVWRQMSDNVSDLNNIGVKIWDEWAESPNYFTKGRKVVKVTPRIVPVGDTEPVFNRPSGYDWKDEENTYLADVWRGMIDRCYKKEHRYYGNYGGKGVHVHPDWWDFDVFIKEAKELPQYKWKKMFPRDFSLDKDYYSSNCYSKETCIWISKKENTWYTDNSEPMTMTSPDGLQTTKFVSIGHAEENMGIARTTISKLLKKGGVVTRDSSYNLKNFIGWELQKTTEKHLRLEVLNKSIGKSYGYQMRNQKFKSLNQVEYVIDQIVNSPKSRRIMTSLYNFGELEDMALAPCVWSTNWSVDDDDRLHLFVKQRSGDIMLGVPYNVLQYSVLHRRIAQVTGRELGSMYWTIDNAHIYDRHIRLADEQVKRDLFHLETVEPKLILPASKDYFGTPLYDAHIINYKHNGNYKYEIAI